MIQQEVHNTKEEIIMQALVSKGVVLWNGIPEHIIESLRLNGYKIKKRKSLKRNK